MNAAELSAALARTAPPLLVHVLPPEHFAARRIESARNACVYEVAFLEQMRALAPDFSQAIVVYGEGAPSLDSEEAARQLRAAGYENVADFRGGLRAWEAAGFPLAGNGVSPAPAQPDGRYSADLDASVIRWTGRNLFNHHHGRLSLSSGEVDWQDGLPKHARFAIDLGSIVCDDLSGSPAHAGLIAHLRSTDFFDAEAHPDARFESTCIEPLPGASEGTPNFHITGQLTLRGVTQEIAFPAVIAAADATHVTAQAQLEIDRTRWGSRYGSGKFFAFLGKHVVNDHIALHLKIHALRQANP